MTAPTNQFADIAKCSQQAVTTAMRTWAETVQRFAGSLAGKPAKLPDAHAVVDRTFDLAQQVLENQRQFAHTLLSTGAQTTEAVAEQATRAAESVPRHAEKAAETVADEAATVADEAGDEVAATARVARKAAKS